MRKLIYFVIASLAALVMICGQAQAQQGPVVTVNGQQVTLQQPPLVRDGRVLVPVRSVFDTLGATVRYDPISRSVIAHSAQGEAIVLPVNSTTATVGGRAVALDVAPTIVMGRTYVPLRFLATALGASVAYNPATQTVAVTPAPTPVALVQTAITPVPPVVQPPKSVTPTFRTVVPAPGSTVGTLEPTIRATFADAIRPGTARIVVDSRNLSAQANISSHQVAWVPDYELAAGEHRVRVDALTKGGRPTVQDWSFRADPGTPTGKDIYSVQLSPDHPITRGNDLHIVVQGIPDGTAQATLAGRKVALHEVYPGVYQGDYTVTERDQAKVAVIVKLTTPDGGVTRMRAPDLAFLDGNPAMQTNEATR